MRIPVFSLGLFAVALIAGCAPAINATAPAPGSSSVPFSAGTILSMRAVATPAGSAPWRAALLAAASGTGGAGSNSAAPLIEFIVRADDGATLSIVQSNNLDLHKGDRVVIRYEATAQLARPS